MQAAARTPEELETLLEDTLVLENHIALMDLFEEGAVLGATDLLQDIRGPEGIEGFWSEQGSYLAEPTRVMQSRDLALIVTGRGASVARRRSDGTWRYVILLMDTNRTEKGSKDAEQRS